jgi:hypothetical protein
VVQTGVVAVHERHGHDGGVLARVEERDQHVAVHLLGQLLVGEPQRHGDAAALDLVATLGRVEVVPAMRATTREQASAAFFFVFF